MILCRDEAEVGGGGVGEVGGCPPRKDIEWQEERAGRVKNKYATISTGD